MINYVESKFGQVKCIDPMEGDIGRIFRIYDNQEFIFSPLDSKFTESQLRDIMHKLEALNLTLKKDPVIP